MLQQLTYSLSELEAKSYPAFKAQIHLAASIAGMPKTSVGEVLKKGSALNAALKDHRSGKGSSKVNEVVPLDTAFCGTTLKKLMKPENLSREDATAVYLAWKHSVDTAAAAAGPALKQKPSKVSSNKKVEGDATAAEPKETPPALRIRSKGAPTKRPAPESGNAPPPKTKKANPDTTEAGASAEPPLTFAPASAADVAKFFGVAKPKNEQVVVSSGDEVHGDLDGEAWDENEDDEWWGWEGDEEGVDEWEAEYPGFWSDYENWKNELTVPRTPPVCVASKVEAQAIVPLGATVPDPSEADTQPLDNQSTL